MPGNFETLVMSLYWVVNYPTHTPLDTLLSGLWQVLLSGHVCWPYPVMAGYMYHLDTLQCFLFLFFPPHLGYSRR